MPGFDISHILLIVFVAILVIGPARLPQISQRLSQIFREGVKAQVEFGKALQEGLQEGQAGSTTTTTPVESGPSWRDFLYHFEELRNRLVISFAAVVVLTAIAYVFSDTIIHVLRAPAGENFVLHAFSPLDGFIIKFRVALYTGLVLAIPVWVYQLYAFFAPAIWPELEARDNKSQRKNARKKFWLTFLWISSSFLLFVAGAVLGYLMLSNMTAFLAAMFGPEIEYFPNADQYISFVIFFLIAMGVAFELPLITLLMIKIGILSPDALRKRRRYSYFVIFVFAELITPVADPIVAPAIVMLPMLVLFEIALFLARFVAPKRAAILPTSSSPQ